MTSPFTFQAANWSNGEALLFKGNDFSQTDITPALPAAAG